MSDDLPAAALPTRDPWAEWQLGRTRRRLHLPHYRAAAVLVGLTVEADPRLLLTLRSSDLPTHQGQISFPGGSLETGESVVEAALREAWEEVGLEPGAVRVLGELDDVFTPAGFHVTPVLARLEAAPRLTLSSEVAAILLPPLSELRALEQPAERRTGPDGQAFLLYRYLWRQHDIWGMTARVIHDVLQSGVG
ncbi:NUDIX hydrolase [Deinococcus alpinitundrae]|uniref:NUDIX hydrolase n=1 Tax=Deinococcus alpinitundrae TaxID=468913 RepID=UPI001ED920F0|nr:CoA pyrophosphatase [Deinococcus alpinitundrae]